MKMLQRGILVIGSLVVLSGCKLAIAVTSGGEVISESGTYRCTSSRVCEIQISEDDFDETFTAVPAEGYEFEKWQGGPGFNCPGSTDPSCRVTNTGFLALFGEFAVTHLGSDKIDHLMPIFKWVGIDTDGDGTPNRFDEDDDNDGLLDDDDPCPLNADPACGVGPFVIGDGKIWYQPDLFIGETWESIDAVCSGGPCNGVLAGLNMDGWTWATRGQVNSLINSYGNIWFGNDCGGVEDFFEEGWRKTNSTFFTGVVYDLMAFTSEGTNNAAYITGCEAYRLTGLANLADSVGAWFFQSP